MMQVEEAAPAEGADAEGADTKAKKQPIQFECSINVPALTVCNPFITIVLGR